MSANKPPPKGNKWWPHVTHYCVTTFITVKPALPLLTQFTHSCAYYTYYMCVLHIHVDHVLVLTCACLCACLVPFPLCPHKLKEIIICLFVFFFPIWGGEPQFFSEPHFSFECHVHFDKRSFSRFYISLPKGTAGYLWLQAIRTLSKPVFINYCFNSWLISAAEILGRPLSEEQFNH